MPAVLCTATLLFVARRPAELCRQWEQEARRAEGTTAFKLVNQLDRYGRYGLPAIVRLASADGTDAAAAACRVLSARLESLRDGATEEDREALGVIAAELTATFGRSDVPASPAAVDLALLLLSTTGRLGLADQIDDDLRIQLFAACDEVLRRAPPSSHAPVSPLLSLLPSRPVVMPRSPTVAPAEPEPPPVTTSAATASSPPVSVSPQPIAPPAPLTAANSAARIETPVPTLSDRAVRPASLPGPAWPTAPATDSVERDQLIRSDAWTLFAALNGSNRELATAELRRRGFSQREIELGERLTSDDPQQRRRFASELPALGVTEAKPWLLRLCRDDDAEVRRIAVTIMATTNDPALQEMLRQLSLDDADDEVRRTAGRATGRIK